MSIFKRLSTTFVSHMDRVVGEIENHDAVVQATLSELRKKIAGAKVRLANIHRDAAKLEQQQQELGEAEQRWGERAIEAAKSDEAKALECMARRQQCRQRADKVVKSLQQYQDTANRLAHDIEESETRLSEMTQKHTLMRARQSSAEALTAVSDAEKNSLRDMDEAFDRWETKITQGEMLASDLEPMDALEQEYAKQENKEALQDELAALITEAKRNED